MHEEILAHAALPVPRVVLGLALRPFSLGHKLYLIREGLDFLQSIELGPIRPTATQFCTAVLICAQSFEETRAMASDRLLAFKLWIWRRRIREVFTNEILFAHELGQFLTYRNEGSAEFPLSNLPRPGRESPRPPGAPYLLRLHHFLMITLGLSEAQAWDYPYGLSKLRWGAHWEQEGGLDLYNDYDGAHDKFVAEQEALLAAASALASPCNGEVTCPA